MSLVAYGSSSDESDNEEESGIESTAVEIKEMVHHPPKAARLVQKPRQSSQDELPSGMRTLAASLPAPKNINDDDTEEEDTEEEEEEMDSGVLGRLEEDENVAKTSTKSGLFSSLPAPRAPEEPEFIPEEDETDVSIVGGNGETKGQAKKVKQPVKITLPSLSQFAPEDEPKKKSSYKGKGSGLFAVLPPPKRGQVKTTSRSLLPYSLQKKPQAPKKNPVVKPKTPASSSSAATNQESDEETEDAASEPGKSGVDFFSLTAANEPVPEMPAEALALEFPALKSQPDGKLQPAEDAVASSSAMEGDLELQNEAGSSSDADVVMDEAAILRLHGKRRRNEEINIIDISADAIIPDAKEWLLKQLTEEKAVRSHSHKKRGGPTAQQRRKHQITYLAFEAKERELELKNQWAQNRITRKQTQLKYGF